MDLKGQLERCGLQVSGDPPEVTPQVGGESVPVLVQPGEGDLVECVVALGDGGNVTADEIERVALDAPGDTSIEQSDGMLRIARQLALPTPGELYDAVYDIAKVAVRLARAQGGSAGRNPTFEKVSELDARAEVTLPPPAMTVDAAATIAVPIPDEPLYWFYVDAPQQIVSGDVSRAVLATLQPGVWYRALEEAGEWVRAADDSGVEGWLGANVVRRQ
jgi:hypothetical protein